jgi:hypothetical protein
MRLHPAARSTAGRLQTRRQGPGFGTGGRPTPQSRSRSVQRQAADPGADNDHIHCVPPNRAFRSVAVLSRKSAIAEEIGRQRADVVSQGRPFSGTGAPWPDHDLRREPPEDGRTGGEIVGRNEYSC